MAIIWGIPGNVEDHNIQYLKEAIQSRRTWIDNIRDKMPYADHGAYGQDRDRINQYESEIRVLNFALKEKTSNGK